MLLTKANRKSLPNLYSTEKSSDPTVQVKFFDPTGSYTWYATEFDGEDRFFGYVKNSQCSELGYFSLQELAEYRGRFGLGIERDRHFSPCPLSEVR